MPTFAEDTFREILIELLPPSWQTAGEISRITAHEEHEGCAMPAWPAGTILKIPVYVMGGTFIDDNELEEATDTRELVRAKVVKALHNVKDVLVQLSAVELPELPD